MRLAFSSCASSPWHGKRRAVPSNAGAAAAHRRARAAAARRAAERLLERRPERVAGGAGVVGGAGVEPRPWVARPPRTRRRRAPSAPAQRVSEWPVRAASDPPFLVRHVHSATRGGPSAAASHERSHLSVHSACPPAARPSTRMLPDGSEAHAWSETPTRVSPTGRTADHAHVADRARGREARDGSRPSHRRQARAPGASRPPSACGATSAAAGPSQRATTTPTAPLAADWEVHRSAVYTLSARPQHLCVVEHAFVQLLRVAARVGPAAVDQHAAVGHCNAHHAPRERRAECTTCSECSGARLFVQPLQQQALERRVPARPATRRRLRSSRRWWPAAKRGEIKLNGGRRFQRRAHRARHQRRRLPPHAVDAKTRECLARDVVVDAVEQLEDEQLGGSRAARTRRPAAAPTAARAPSTHRCQTSRPRTARAATSRAGRGAGRARAPGAAVCAGGAGGAEPAARRTNCRSRCTAS